MDRSITQPDEAAFQLSPTSMPRFQIGGTLLSIGFVAAIFLGVVNLHHGAPRVLPGELVFPVSPDVYAAAIFLATFVFILSVGYAIAGGRSASPFRSAPSLGSRVQGLVIGSILLVSALCCVARASTQIVGFVGLHPAAVPASFEVVDTDWYTGKSSSVRRYLLRVRYGPGGRTFDDEVPKAVYDVVRPGDTVPIPVETGRFGLMRAMIDAAPLTQADVRHPTTPHP